MSLSENYGEYPVWTVQGGTGLGGMELPVSVCLWDVSSVEVADWELSWVARHVRDNVFAQSGKTSEKGFIVKCFGYTTNGSSKGFESSWEFFSSNSSGPLSERLFVDCTTCVITFTAVGPLYVRVPAISLKSSKKLFPS